MYTVRRTFAVIRRERAMRTAAIHQPQFSPRFSAMDVVDALFGAAIDIADDRVADRFATDDGFAAGV